MATSSILRNFIITDKDAAEKFIDALDWASEQPPRTPTHPVKKPLRDPEAIKQFFAKENGNSE